MTSIDPTRTIERMASRLRSEGVEHPVAGAVALAARGHARMAPEAFADVAVLPIEVVQSAEAGSVAFGALPVAIGLYAGATGADLMVLADLEAEWRRCAAR
ncbi:MAG: hypothetical protein DHS20C19_01560 [Acidimicrobiales bacterium]|nr:MAG: hypothetical protein DHS20C19_01560 [Acidimicrobiales bacterium]